MPANDFEEYNRKHVLQALCMYHPKYFHKTNQMAVFYKGRLRFGNQFILDVFLASEEFINKWPKWWFTRLRTDLVNVLNNRPDFGYNNER